MAEFTVVGQYWGGTGEGTIIAVMLLTAQSKMEALRRFIARANTFDVPDVEIFEGYQLDNPVVKQMLSPHIMDTIKTNLLYTEVFAELYANAG